MKIRLAELSDMPRLLDIYNYEVVNGTATFDLHPKTMEERMEWFYDHNKDNHPLFVAEEDGVAVGYATLSQYRPKDAYNETVELSVYIDAAYRNRGIAKRLMQEIVAEARGREDIHTIISVITEGNDVSVHLHEELGFVCCGEMREVGKKFGRKLGTVSYQLMV